MRFRFKPWAMPELESSKFVCLDPELYKNNWSNFFENSTLPISLELGCGKGRFISSLAKIRPEYNYLGIDIEVRALVYAKRKIEAQNITNAKLLRCDISQTLNFFSEGEISEIFINFPNPWPKKKQQKRRLTHPRQLIQYRKYLKDGGEIRFKTDDKALFQASLKYFPLMGFEILEVNENLRSNSSDDIRNIQTEYEDRWLNQGINIKAINVKKINTDEKILKEIVANFEDFPRDDIQ